MKTLIICLQSIDLGGVGKELFTILHRCNPKEFDITVLVLYGEDEKNIKQLPPWVKYINIDIDKDYYLNSVHKRFLLMLKKREFKNAFDTIVKRIFNRTSLPISIESISPMQGSYDLAICFHSHAALMINYVAEKIKAKEKILWIHGDFYTTKFPIKVFQKYLSSYYKFVSVSDRVGREFVQIMPEMTGKQITAHNIVDIEEIIKKSKEPIEELVYIEAPFRILTVGRFDREKGIDIAIEVCRLLRDKYRIKVKWFIIGYGDLIGKYQSLICQYLLEDSFFILGKKDNPYPYIKQCDLYVQPSRNEAYCLTMIEAKVLNRPIVCTNFAGADEQIVNGENGIIVDSFFPEDIANEIIRLYNDEPLRQKFIDNLSAGIDAENEENWENIHSILAD